MLTWIKSFQRGVKFPARGKVISTQGFQQTAYGKMNLRGEENICDKVILRVTPKNTENKC